MRERDEKRVTHAEIHQVAGLLARAYPYIEARKRAEGVFADPPLDSLVRAILSQHTSDSNRDRAFAALRARFRDWNTVADAPVQEVAAALYPVNFAATKAARLQEILRRLRDEQGGPTLDFLRDWPTERIREYLTDFNGVGPKSAAIVCLFALGRPVVPVDTHVYRVTRRLGWIGPRVSAERAHAVLGAVIPPSLVLPLHMGLWEHGRVTCRPRPRCAQCAVYRCCTYEKKTAPEPPVETAIAITAGREAPAA
ncbi:MAG TPA: endonuclease III [Armatimonadota bacterium]|nr:endonuclease III [Armatimonadota bacterium]HOS44377.1 endonuclease III [Armatimonadota bacterium]